MAVLLLSRNHITCLFQTSPFESISQNICSDWSDLLPGGRDYHFSYNLSLWIWSEAFLSNFYPSLQLVSYLQLWVLSCSLLAQCTPDHWTISTGTGPDWSLSLFMNIWHCFSVIQLSLPDLTIKISDCRESQLTVSLPMISFFRQSGALRME